MTTQNLSADFLQEWNSALGFFQDPQQEADQEIIRRLTESSSLLNRDSSLISPYGVKQLLDEILIDQKKTHHQIEVLARMVQRLEGSTNAVFQRMETTEKIVRTNQGAIDEVLDEFKKCDLPAWVKELKEAVQAIKEIKEEIDWT